MRNYYDQFEFRIVDVEGSTCGYLKHVPDVATLVKSGLLRCLFRDVDICPDDCCALRYEDLVKYLRDGVSEVASRDVTIRTTTR